MGRCNPFLSKKQRVEKCVIVRNAGILLVRTENRQIRELIFYTKSVINMSERTVRVVVRYTQRSDEVTEYDTASPQYLQSIGLWQEPIIYFEAVKGTSLRLGKSEDLGEIYRKLEDHEKVSNIHLIESKILSTEKEMIEE